MRVLLVEDDAAKLKVVASKLMTVLPVLHVETAHNIAQAKGLLRSSHYDILILDVSLPASADRHAEPRGGLDLLRAIVRNPSLNKPREIIGLTAYSELKKEFEPDFASGLWTIVHFDNSSDSWWLQIKSKIGYLQASLQKYVGTYDIELCVMTALYEPELKAVLNLPWAWEELKDPNDPTQYWKGSFSRGGEPCTVVAACCTRMGMPSAATLAMKMISKFRPRFICMTGIAAGVKEQCSLGDVVAADPCWDYGSGKIQAKVGEIVFFPAPEQIPLNPFVKAQIRWLSQDSAILDRIRHEWPGKRVDSVLRVHVGPFASGASVLSDGASLEKVRQQQRKVIGIDMEAYAIFAAAQESPYPQPLPIVLKGVVDHGDPEKDDSYQGYSSYASAQVLRRLMEASWEGIAIVGQ